MPASDLSPIFPQAALARLLPIAFEEDEGAGDITSLATIAADMRGIAAFLCKRSGVLAGLPAVAQVLAFRGVKATLHSDAGDGDVLTAGETFLTVEGPLRGLLVCERILLNIMQRLSGIATVTRNHADALEGSGTRLLDTRKTPPGWRALDKYAVAVGGGTNHRQGLFDEVLIKDNHVEACGSVRAAVDKVQAEYGGKYRVEAEVRSLEELRTLFGAPVDAVLLDNMDDAALAEAVKLARAHAPDLLLEASGNMDLERLARIRGLGLDFVSVGALTHSVTAMDISLNISRAVI